MGGKLNAAGRALLERFEGDKLEAYQDEGGVWTIGRGSTRNVSEGMVITQAASDARFEDDIAATCSAVDAAFAGGVPLNENQYSAFVVFAFNVRDWKDRPLAAHVKRGDVEGAKAHWLLYDKVRINGVLTPSPGLLARREAELALYLTPVV